MALHDYVCPACGHFLIDVNVPCSVGAQAGAPECSADGQRMEWIPQIGRMDAYEPFQEFETFDGQNRPVLIDSLRKMRQIEQESEHMAANGEGQPLIWRRYSQDNSNRDVPTLGKWTGPAETPDPTKRQHLSSPIRHGAEKPETEFGPGVNESNASALGGLE